MQTTKGYSIRAGIIFLLFILLYATILFNLYLIQIKACTFFTHLGERQYLTTVTQYPPRAPIYDRHGHYVAFNKDSIAAFVLPQKLSDKQQLLSFLARFFPHAHERLLHSKKDAHFMYVARRLTPAQIQCIEQHAVVDIQFLNEPSRFYPVAAAAPVIGLTDIDNHGLFGMELYANEQLAGKPTTYTLEKDARSGHFYFARETKVVGKDGQPLMLTIDGTLQFLAYEELQTTVREYNAKEGAVVILDPDNGHILAMVSLPTFDPNKTTTLDLSTTKNRVITECYELGSVIKICATLAALEEGAVTPDELIDCENLKTTYIDGRKVNTVPTSVAGIIPFYQVIEKSNNIGIAKVVKRIGPKLYDHYIRLGFGTKTGVEFPGEQAGFVNPPSQWSKQSLFSLSYGYEISATLLQLARVFCMIANGGYAVQPTLLLDHVSKRGKKLYTDSTIRIVNDMLENTTQRGTTKKAQIKGYSVRSKTGTANLLVNGVYSPTDNIYTCAGIVEKGPYKRVIVTFVKESTRKGIYASMVAAPLFERVAQKMIINEKIL